jgi:hypothetical protein
MRRADSGGGSICLPLATFPKAIPMPKCGVSTQVAAAHCSGRRWGILLQMFHFWSGKTQQRFVAIHISEKSGNY